MPRLLVVPLLFFSVPGYKYTIKGTTTLSLLVRPLLSKAILEAPSRPLVEVAAAVVGHAGLGRGFCWGGSDPGFEVSGSGFGVSGSGFRVWGVGFRV